MAVVLPPRWKRGPSIVELAFAGLRAAEKKEKQAVPAEAPQSPRGKSGTPESVTGKSFPKAAPPVRSRPYRELVASFECIHCGIVGHSQAAHAPPTAKGKKESDADLFPLCAVSANDCHRKFDASELHATPQERRAQAVKWAKQTQQRAIKTGMVPKAVLAVINPKRGEKR